MKLREILTMMWTYPYSIMHESRKKITIDFILLIRIHSFSCAIYVFHKAHPEAAFDTNMGGRDEANWGSLTYPKSHQNHSHAHSIISCTKFCHFLNVHRQRAMVMSGQTVDITTLFLSRLTSTKPLTVLSARSFISNWQLHFLNQWKGEYDHRKYFMCEVHALTNMTPLYLYVNLTGFMRIQTQSSAWESDTFSIRSNHAEYWIQ